MLISIQVEGLKRVQHKLKLSADKLQNMRNFWKSVGMYVQKQTIRERFDKQQSPEGQKWKPLSPATIKHRMKHHKKGIIKILQDTGELRRSIACEADNNSVKVGSKLKYARTHQFGRGNIPARPFLGLTQAEKTYITSMFTHYVKRHLLGG